MKISEYPQVATVAPGDAFIINQEVGGGEYVTRRGSFQALINSLPEGEPGPQGADGSDYEPFPVVTEAGTSRTLALSDAQKWIRCTNAGAVTVTVPPQGDVSWPANAEIVIEQAGEGQVTIAEGTGVTVNSTETLKTSKQWAVVALKRVAENLWTLVGEREVEA